LVLVASSAAASPEARFISERPGDLAIAGQLNVEYTALWLAAGKSGVRWCCQKLALDYADNETTLTVAGRGTDPGSERLQQAASG
jgi:hypothetical protein